MSAQKIDLHHHVFPPQYLAALERLGVKSEGGGIPFPQWSTARALEMMDRNGIQAAVASVASPGVYFGDAAAARDLARLSNEYLAGLVRDHPTRFGAFASLPLPDTGGAVREAAYAFDVLGCDGVMLLASVADRFLGDPGFEELMQELDRRKATVFVHPNVHSTSRQLGLEFPEALFEFIADTTRAILNLMLSGTLERHPNIRWIFSHAGGAAPYLAWRWTLADHHPHYQARIPKGTRAYLSKLYYDTAISTVSPVMNTVLDLAGPEQIVYGSDFPYVPPPVIAAGNASLERLPEFDAASRAAMERGNALALLPRLAAALAADLEAGSRERVPA